MSSGHDNPPRPEFVLSDAELLDFVNNVLTPKVSSLCGLDFRTALEQANTDALSFSEYLPSNNAGEFIKVTVSATDEPETYRFNITNKRDCVDEKLREHIIRAIPDGSIIIRQSAFAPLTGTIQELYSVWEGVDYEITADPNNIYAASRKYSVSLYHIDVLDYANTVPLWTSHQLNGLPMPRLASGEVQHVLENQASLPSDSSIESIFSRSDLSDMQLFVDYVIHAQVESLLPKH